MDRLECDRMFAAVIDTGSFAAAAKRLGTSTGQASKLVSRLEKELGVQLIMRTTRALGLSEVGRAYYERIKGIIEEFDALDASVRNASGAPSGRLRITAPVTFGTTQLAPVLISFAAAFPDIQLDVSFSDRLINLVDEGFDAAIRIGQPADSSLIAKKLCAVRIVLVASPAYLEIRQSPATPSELADHHCIVDTNFNDPLSWRFKSGDRHQTIAAEVRSRLHFSNAEACLAAADAGLGIARVPSFVAGTSLRAGSVRTVLSQFEDEPRGLYAVYPPARHLALKVRVLVDFLADAFRGQPAWDNGWT
ncbi:MULTISPECIES: LysR family transcriptional regulator [unclassified Rhizobium]|uniref:LysR family transcriptional regulator n=1 Tax=unclassified Rhizobium TaxID=2613769 RepID=UPI0002EA1F09|nr:MULTISPECIES: LysR family transcriptional regulator [unclassified Rhizobium]UJW77549.1 LysR family transcriptional regulator [Rhizobium sp. SL42]